MSHRPLADFLRDPRPGDAGSHLILPLEPALTMPPAWQHHLVALLTELHHTTTETPWPHYRVHPIEYRPLPETREVDRIAVGITTDLNDDGQLIYRDLDGSVISDPARRHIAVVLAPRTHAEKADEQRELNRCAPMSVPSDNK